MKKTLPSLAALMFCAALPAAAQTSEGFETGLPTTASTSPTNVTLGSGVWTILKGVRTTTRHGGAYGLSLANGSTTSSYADTPAFAGIASVTVWARGSGASTLRVEKSVGGGSFVAVSSPAITSSFASYTIAVNETGSVRLRFRNATSQTHYLDDVTITAGGSSTPTPTATPTTRVTPTPTTRATATPTTRVTATPTATPTTRPTATPTGTPTATPTATTTSTATPPAPGGITGFATLNRDGVNGTTGGSGTPVVVSSYAALVAAVGDHTPRVVHISGTITPASGVKMISVGSNKTILGLGSSAVLQGVGLDVSGWTPAVAAANGGGSCEPATQNNYVHVSNVIIRNITFDAPTDDGVQVSCYSHHVWIDHNTFTNGTDGSVDVKRGSDWVTVSWNHFVQTTKTMLLGHDDGNGAQDTGKLHVTYHHNFFDNSDQRHPRVRFGQAHVYNNYALGLGDYMIGKGVSCSIHADGNYVDAADAVTDDYGGSDLTWDATNITVNVGLSDLAVANGQGFNPRSYYSYTLDPAASIPSMVLAGAGAGRI